MSVTMLIGGCLGRPGTGAMPTTTPLTPNQPASSPTIASVATSTPTPRTTVADPPTTTPTPAPTESETQEGFTDRGDPFRGDPEATVVFEEFSSYQCGFCGKYFQESYPSVMSDYVETGRVIYVFRDFPLPGQPQSPLAAEAANCAGEMGGGSAFWAMHDRLYARQAEWSGRRNAGDILREYAGELGLGKATFGECLDSEATRAQIEADISEGIARGVRGTPTFFVNGRPLVGAQPYPVIAQAIDAALAAEESAAEPGGDPLQLAPVSALSPEIRQLPPMAQEAYRFAIANPDVLEAIPCYCGCNQVGHVDNRMCYVRSESADGTVVLDDHAAG
jgi:protein-disulfide isomerase